jgi:glycosyltransferase involved in cell wall biosynthesis
MTSTPHAHHRVPDIEQRVRVACVMPYTLGIAPSQRFRWEQWAPILEQHGVELDYVTFSTPEIARARAHGETAKAVALSAARYPAWVAELSRLRQADVVVVHRNAALAGPPLAELAIARSGKPLVFDFDDAIHLPPENSKNNALWRFVRSDYRAALLSREATLVSVGNPNLAEFARGYNANTVVWPTTVPLSVYTERPEPSPDAEPVIGWMGSPSTANYLVSLLPLLRELQTKRRFRLLVVGASIDLQGVHGDCIAWTAETEVSSLHRMDIGLMPIPDTPWSRGKCAAKAIQYLGVGVPAVVSDVGVNGIAVPDGVAGFVVRTDAEWAMRLTQMLDDASLRRRLGKTGREHIAANYSAEAWAPRIAATLQDLGSC